MSDDDATRPVPREPATERLGAAGAPTERLGTAGAPAAEVPPTGARRMTWLWVLIGVLGLAVVVLLVLLLQRPGATPVGGATATTTPSAAPSEAPSTPPASEPTTEATSEPAPPAATGPVFTSFSVEPEIADCAGGAASVPLVFSWSSEDATEAWIGVGTTNAQAAPYESVPTSASDYANLAFQCSEESQVYTVTISGPTGLTHHSVTIARG